MKNVYVIMYQGIREDYLPRAPIVDGVFFNEKKAVKYCKDKEAELNTLQFWVSKQPVRK